MHPNNIEEFMYEPGFPSLVDHNISMNSALKYWKTTLLEIRSQIKSLKETENLIEVSYETILLNPGPEITKIAEFLGLKGDKYLNHATRIPRPFPENQQIRKLPKEHYMNYYQTVEGTMELYGYPFNFSANNGFIRKINEIYRGRSYYFNKAVNKVKSSTPTVLRKRLKRLKKLM